MTSGSGPVEGALVTLHELAGTPGSWDYTDFVDETYTQADGTYTFTALTPGAYYTVEVQAPEHASAWLGGAASWEDAEYFQSVEDGNDLPSLTLRPGLTVRGTVEFDGSPVTGVGVSALRWDGAAFEETNWSETDDAGMYEMRNLQEGTYTLWFDADYTEAHADSVYFGGGSSMPTGIGDASKVFTVDADNPVMIADAVLPAATVATGQVRGSDGPLNGASVTAFVWTADTEGGWWEERSRSRTSADGGYTVKVPRNSMVTFRFGAPGHTRQFLGGGTELPESPDSTSSVEVGAASVSVPQVTLAVFDTKFGDAAGQKLDFCYANALPNELDVSSGEVPIPAEFGLTFFGQPYTELFVNSHGNITFGHDNLTFTPEGLTGETYLPIIAPFWADVDQTANDQVTTYGFSTDGETFCAVWAGMGYFDQHVDKLNTFQLVLSSAEDNPGRSPGDFDITFNYDQVQWESGDMSGGADGLGGTTAAVGFSAGTGLPGSFMELSGSFEPGALLDGGPQSLVAGSMNTTQPGRYIFEVRNEGATLLYGSMKGIVEDSSGEPVPNAYVEACSTSSTGSYCPFTETDQEGNFEFPAVLPGDFDLRVWPPTGDLFGGSASVTVVEAEPADVGTITLEAPEPMPAEVTLETISESASGVPAVSYADDLDFAVKGCENVANPTYSVLQPNGTPVLDANGDPRENIPLAETSPGVYEAVIPAFAPYTGEAEITTNVPATCGGDPVGFNLYIDPSGIVTDQYGRPIADATVTLLRSDTASGVYAPVTDETVMSPSNRTNPDTTDTNGYFRWDVIPGWYKVKVEKDGCDTLTSPGMSVPPERIDLLLKLTCPTVVAPAPVVAPALTGTPKVGETLTASKGQWPLPLEWVDTEWFRGATKVAQGTSYTVTPADAGQTLRAVVTAARPDYRQEQGTGAVVQFTKVTEQVSTTVEGAPPGGGGGGGGGAVPPASTPKSTTPPTIEGVARVGHRLTAGNGTWDKAGLTFSHQWLRDGQAIAGADGTTYAPTAADLGAALSVRVTARGAGLTDGTAQSQTVTVQRGRAPRVIEAPSLEGRAGVGRTVTVAPGTWDIRGLDITYQWFRNGQLIRGATGMSHQLRPLDAGQKLAVVVTAKKPGYEAATFTTAVVRVAKLRSTTAVEVVRVRSAFTRLAVDVDVPGIARPVGRLVVRADGKRVAVVPLHRRHAGERTFRVAGLKPGAHRMVVVYRGSAWTQASKDAVGVRTPR
ncbi:carboxypeptidase regulatory-like domain-containing protein [Nocardioides pakistanensis]